MGKEEFKITFVDAFAGGVYYKKQTHIRAFGNTGLRMLAFQPDVEPTGHLTGFNLDNETLLRAKKHLAADLIKEFFDNFTPTVLLSSGYAWTE